MSKLIIDKPYRVLVPKELDSDNLRKFLSYKNKSVEFELRKIKSARWYDPDNERMRQRVLELEAQRNQSLLKMQDGEMYTYAGLSNDLNKLYGLEIENQINYPQPKPIPWQKIPTKQMRPYQQEAFDKLLEVKHGAVSIATGLGKTLIFLNLVKELGLETLVVVPTKSIADQVYDMFCEYLGKKYVGLFGDGKKQANKRIVIGIAASLTRVNEQSPYYDMLSSKQVLIADESHTIPAPTLSTIALGLAKNVPYRFFFSATQTRTDGAEKLLKSIIGPIIINMTVQDGVEQGYLAKPVFNIVNITSDSSYKSADANSMSRAHFLNNPKVLKNAASITNMSVLKMNSPVLILIDEFEQYEILKNYIRVPHEFANSGTDVTEQVKKFNEGHVPVLIGTSAIALGTDILAAKTMILIQKGMSEIKFKQSIGRGIRKTPDKDRCTIFDFDVVNIPVVHRHAMNRIDIYQTLIGSCDKINLLDFTKNGILYE